MTCRYLICALAWLAAACSPRADYAEINALEREYRAAGLLRSDRDPPGIWVDNRQLARNFREIMFYDEYDFEDGAYVARRTPKLLHKWSGPVTYRLAGETITNEDRAHLQQVVSRVRRASGLEISPDEEDPTILMLLLTRHERNALGRALARRDGENAFNKDLRADLGETLCAAYPLEDPESGVESGYIIVIPAELRGLWRRGCIEEEFGQAFGPSADFADARPSVFNDDEEFALLTAHDELLLRILYDPRLRTGMTETEGMPIVKQIIAELRREVASKGDARDGRK